jgi:hypothetical protein
MLVSLSGLERFRVGKAHAWRSRVRRGGLIDKLKFRFFKPLSLDVIFHDCEIVDDLKGNIDAFAG